MTSQQQQQPQQGEGEQLPPPGATNGDDVRASTGTAVGTLKTIEMEEDEDGGLLLMCHRRASAISVVSSFRDSNADMSNVVHSNTTNTLPTRVGKFEDSYTLGTTLHQAEWTRVHLCEHKLTQQQRIVKVVRETCSYCHEYEIMRSLDHPNLPVVYELFQPPSMEYEFYMVLRYYEGGSLEEFLKNIQSAPPLGRELNATACLWQVLCTIHYLHTHQIVHCAVRPENILLRHPLNNFRGLTLISFQSSFIKDPNKQMNYIRGDHPGQGIVYLAPEILQDVPNYDEKIDVWACGVILYRFLSNSLPFVQSPSDTQEQIRRRILKGDLQFPDDPWASISQAAQDFVRHLLARDPQQRPSAAEALKHIWLSEMRKEVQNALDPSAHVEALELLGNLRHYANRDHIFTYKDKLVLRLRQAICISMVSRLFPNATVDQVFGGLDTNHNGVLDKKQLQQGYYQAYSRMLPAEEVDELWKCFDVDSAKDKSLHYSEFKVAALGNRVWFDDDRIKEAFELLDKHGKQTITSLELKEVFAKAHVKDEDMVHVMELVDTSGTGYISYDDFSRMMKLEFLEKRDKYHLVNQE